VSAVNKKAIAISVAVPIVVIFVAFFTLVPVVTVSTHPSTLPQQLAFIQIPTSESLSCAVFGVGAANWPTSANSTTYQSYTYHYQMGCPPLAASSYTYTESQTTT
jgi:hypothetical protein